MLNLSARTRVTELQQGPPALMQALQSTGLFRAGDDPDVSLGELCWTFGFNPGILLMMLESADVEQEAPPLDIAPYLAMPLAALVEHLEQVHHAWLREHLPRLVAISAAVAEANPQEETLAELHAELSSLAAELDAHLLHEEQALFPMVRDLAARVAIAPTRCGSRVGGPIACMENEHRTAADALRRMRALTDGYRAADDADRSRRTLFAGLADLDRDLREHMYKENEALFPRALDAQRG
jgi:regulator of cell morphogenesis and NO signaling